MSRRINLFPDYLPRATIRVLPADKNRVRIPIGPLDSADYADLQIFAGQWAKLACCFGLARCTGMEPKIVKGARTLIERRQRDRDEAAAAADRDAVADRRLGRLEALIGSIEERLDRVLLALDTRD